MVTEIVDPITSYPGWAAVLEGFRVLFKHEHMTPDEYMAFYQTIYNIISNNARTRDDRLVGLNLYNSLKNVVTEYATEITNTFGELSGNLLLDQYCREWDTVRSSANWLKGLCATLNRNIRESNGRYGNISTIESMVLQQFKTTVFDKLKHKIQEALIEKFCLERADTIMEAHKAAILASDLQLYKTNFEVQFLEETHKFYTSEVREFMQKEGSASYKNYIKMVEQILEQEENQVSLLLHTSTFPALLDVCRKVLITDQLDFFKYHFGALLEENAHDDLEKMHSLCPKVNSGLAVLQNVLQNHVAKEVAERVQDTFEEPKVFVGTVLEVLEKYEGLAERCFPDEPGFAKSVELAVMDFINMDAAKSAQVIAKYCDGLANEMEMDEVIRVIEYLENKDLFLKFYNIHLRKRLIDDLSSSDESEASFIKKLMDCCGSDSTNGLLEMVQDHQVSKNVTSDLEFSVVVLSTDSWPIPSIPLTLPQSLLTPIEGFTNFYNEKRRGRKLQWDFDQSRGELLSTAFGKGQEYTFMATGTQMCTLLLFNDQTSYTAQQVMDGTGMDAEATSNVLGSLIRTRILFSEQEYVNGKEISMEDTITLNTSYANEKTRVDLSEWSMAEQVEKDLEQVCESIDDDKRKSTSTVILSIMKAFKSLSHQQLMHEVFTQLGARFKPKVTMVKMCIEELIEDQYFKRSAEQRDHYVI